MQVFVPYSSPIDVAKCLDKKRLRKQLIECDQIRKAIFGQTEAWKNHPVVNMYLHNTSWLELYRDCLLYFQDGDIDWAQDRSDYADQHFRPLFLTSDFCDQHKRRLYTKAPELYPQFAEYGASEENWYVVDGELVKYVDGKRI